MEVEETPASIAKERTETYTKENGTEITNNIEQNIGNRGDTKTTIGDDNEINNSQIGDNLSQNKGEIKVENTVSTPANIPTNTPTNISEEKAAEAKERAQNYKNENNTTITNNVEQNVGNKEDTTTTVGDNNNINNSQIGNDKSQNTGQITIDNLNSTLDNWWSNKQEAESKKIAEENALKAAQQQKDVKAQEEADALAKQQAKKKETDDYVWGLANERAKNFSPNSGKGFSYGNTKTINNAYTFNNDFLQNTGNKGNITTSFGNNNKLYNVSAGNDYSINLGNINNSNHSM